MALHCPLAEFGCPYWSQDHEGLRKHLTENVFPHLTQLCEGIKLTYSSADILQKMQTKIKHEMDIIHNRFSTLEHNLGMKFIWKIDKYKEKFYDAKVGNKTVIYSPPFLTGRQGYKLIMLSSLYGDGKAKGKFMSLFISICRGEYDAILPWPFSHKITFSLLNQEENPLHRKHITFEIRPNLTKENKPFLGRPMNERNASFGAQNFADLVLIEKAGFLKEDCIFIQVYVDMRYNNERG